MPSATVLCPPRPHLFPFPWTSRVFSLHPQSFQPKRALTLCLPFCRGSSHLAAGNKPNLVSPEPASQAPDDESGAVGKRVERLDLGWLPVFPHVFMASMANFLFGYHIGVMNGPIQAIAQELGFDGKSFIEGLVVSIFIAGAFIGSVGSSALIDKLGCRRTLQIDTIPLILGAILSAQAHSIDEMLLGRFLVGLGIGVNTALVPIYISEVSPTKYRGSLGTTSQIGTCLGIIASLCLGIPSEGYPHWWRTMLYLASVPAFILLFGMQFAVESPRWLCKVGRVADAKKVVGSIWSDSDIERSIEEIQAVITNDIGDFRSSWVELLVEPHKRGYEKCYWGSRRRYEVFLRRNR